MAEESWMVPSSSSSSTGLVAAASSSLVAVLSPTSSTGAAQAANAAASPGNAGSGVRVLLFQRSTGHLQTNLTAQLLLRQGVSPESSSSFRQQRLFLVGEDEYCVLVLFDGEWIAWDLSRGVVACHHTLSSSSSSKKKKKKRKSSDGDDDHGGSTSTALLLDAAVRNGSLYLLVEESSSKLRVHEHDVRTGKLLRKIKAPSSSLKDNGEGAAAGSAPQHAVALMAVTDEYLVMRYATTVRLLKLETGSKEKKIHLAKYLESNDEGEGGGSVATTGGCFYSVAAASMKGGNVVVATATPVSGRCRIVVMSDLDRSTIRTWTRDVDIDDPSSGSSNGCLEFLPFSSSTSHDPHWTLLVGNSVVLRSSSSGSSGGGDEISANVKEKKVVAASDVDRWSVVVAGTTPHSSGDAQQNLVAVLYKGNQYQIRPVIVPIDSDDDDDDDPIQLSWVDGSGETLARADSADTNGSKKRTRDAAVLGPGQMGASIAAVSEQQQQQKATKRSRNEDGEEEEGKETQGEDDEDDPEAPTIAERLAQLRKALEDEESDLDLDDEDGDGDGAADDDDEKKGSKKPAPSFQPKKATTESLTKLLHQSLQSGDDSLLELALAVRDARVVRASCMQMDKGDLKVLFASLTTRLAQKPTRGDALVVWIVSILQTQKMTSMKHLQALQNLLQERCQVFPELLRLEGRLSMLADDQLGASNE